MKKTFSFVRMAKKKALCLVLAVFSSVNFVFAKIEYGRYQDAPNKGEVKVLCILAEFSNEKFTMEDPQKEYDHMWNDIGYSYYGSIHDYYRKNSYERLNIKAKVVGPYKMKRSSRYDYAEELILDALKEAAKDKSINWKEFDSNGDKIVDIVHVICSSKETFYSKKYWFDNDVKLKDNYYARRYFITSRNSSMGEVCHELGHVLGAPDFFCGNTFLGTGDYDVMGYNYFGACPPHHNPYTKAYIYGWVSPEEIEPTVKNKKYILKPSHRASSFYRINTPTEGEFFLMEYKDRSANDFNHNVPGSGMLIYHVTNTMTTGINDLGSLDMSVIANEVNTSHPLGCYIVNANSIYAQPTSSNTGSYGLRQEEWPFGYYKHFFTAETTPSATSWAGEPTGVDVCFIQKVGGNIEFVVNPRIEGPKNLVDQDTFSIPNVPADAKIKWEYKFNGIFGGNAKVVNGDNSSSLVINVNRPNSLLEMNDKQLGRKPIRMDAIDKTNLTKIKKELSKAELVADTAGKAEHTEVLLFSNEGTFAGQSDVRKLKIIDTAIGGRNILAIQIKEDENLINKLKNATVVPIRALRRVGSIELTVRVTYGNEDYSTSKSVPCYISYETYMFK
ncbi:MAG: hypothetical protein J5621_07055 [Paludibacteraceae bacterium]|nr:hypothetical protein [Paludibacteraceae bacterium]